MRSLRARISIQSKPSDVYHVLTDFASYAKWNPWLTDACGEAKEGARVLVKPDLTSLLGYRLRYRLEKVQPKDFLRWQEEGWFSSLFRTMREYQVYTKLGGTAIYSIRLYFQGPLAPVVGFFYAPAVRRGLRKEAEALKGFCEKNFPLAVEEGAPGFGNEDQVNLDELLID